jgi:glycosyltransferase involved in cell wall biosynthesis
MKPIRILHVIQTIHPVESASSRLAVLMAASQAADGHHVRLLTGDSAATMILAEKAFESYDGFRRILITHAHDRAKVGYLLGSHAAEHLPGLIAQSDILHVHGVWEALLHRAAMTASRKGVPIVVSTHGLKNALFAGPLRPLKGLLLAAGWKKLLQHASLVHALDAEEEEEIGRLGIQDRVRIVPDSLDIGTDLLEVYPVKPAA